jgi:hypothetical protein
MTRRDYHRRYYEQNRIRRRAQRLASKWGDPSIWRAFLPIARQEAA